jgi:hypothetical protein
MRILRDNLRKKSYFIYALFFYIEFKIFYAIFHGNHMKYCYDWNYDAIVHMIYKYAKEK